MSDENYNPEVLSGMSHPEALAYLNEHIDRLTFKLEELPDSVDLYLTRVELYQQRARTERAIETSMVMLASESMGGTYYHTYQFGYKENYQLAFADLQIALQLDATNARAYYLRASINTDAQNDEEAVLDIGKAIELKYENLVDAYSLQAVLLKKLKQWAAAIQSYSSLIVRSSVLAFDPLNLASIYCGRAEAYVGMKQLHKALLDYQQALAKLHKLRTENNVDKEEVDNALAYVFFAIGGVTANLCREGEHGVGIPLLRSCLSLLPDDLLDQFFVQTGLREPFEGMFDRITPEDYVSEESFNISKFRPYIELWQDYRKRGWAIDIDLISGFARYDDRNYERKAAGDYGISIAVASLLIKLEPIAGLLERASLYKRKADYHAAKTNIDDTALAAEHRTNMIIYSSNAVSDLEDFFAAGPIKTRDLFVAYRLAGDSYERLGDYEAAVTAYTGAIEVAGDTLETRELEWINEKLQRTQEKLSKEK